MMTRKVIQRASWCISGKRYYEGYSGIVQWCWWDSCGDPGRGRVQICHKGAPGRDRPRMKPRNINDSLPAFRLGRGLCGRFGQSAGADRPGRVSAGRAAGGAVITKIGRASCRERV